MCFTPASGHVRRTSGCPLWARSGHRTVIRSRDSLFAQDVEQEFFTVVALINTECLNLRTALPLYNTSAANGWLFPGIDPQFFNGPALNLSIPAAHDYFLQKLSYFPSVGVKGYKIDRGEEGEMPGKLSCHLRRNA